MENLAQGTSAGGFAPRKSNAFPMSVQSGVEKEKTCYQTNLPLDHQGQSGMVTRTNHQILIELCHRPTPPRLKGVAFFYGEEAL
jgi:hypothetical protein